MIETVDHSDYKSPALECGAFQAVGSFDETVIDADDGECMGGSADRDEREGVAFMGGVR